MSHFAALERELRTFSRRSQTQRATVSAIAHPYLDPETYSLLAYFSAHPGASGSDVASHFHVGRATISRQLSRVAELGLIDRQMDPDDSRGQIINLTEFGRDQLERAMAARAELLSEILSDWSDTDVHVLAELMGRYLRSFSRWRSAQSDAV